MTDHHISIPAIAQYLIGVLILTTSVVISQDCKTDTGGGRQVKIVRTNGRSFLYFNLNRLHGDHFKPADRDGLQFYFFTSLPDGLIWHQDLNNTNTFIALEKGHLVFHSEEDSPRTVRIPIGEAENVRFNDNRWHLFKLSRTGRDIRLSVDGRYVQNYTFSRDVQFLAPAAVHIGGSTNNYEKTNGQVLRNFAGGLTEMYYVIYIKGVGGSSTFSTVNLIEEINADISIGMLGLPTTGGFRPPEARTTSRPIPSQPSYVHPTQPPRPAPSASRSITLKGNGLFFTPAEQFIASSGSSVSFKIQTVNKNGLLLFTTNARRKFLGIELNEGKLYFIHNLGDISKRVETSNQILSDGRQHKIDVRFYNPYISLKVDEFSKRVLLTGNEKLPVVFGPLYIGGYKRSDSLPWYIRSAKSYTGCLEDLQISGRYIDFQQYLQDQRYRGLIEKRCTLSRRGCPSRNPCNKGRCINTLDGFACDCRGTGYRGDQCQFKIGDQKPKPDDRRRNEIVRSNGQNFFVFDLKKLPQDYFGPANNEEFQFVFFTSKPDGLVWHHEIRNLKMFIAMENGHLVFYIDDGSGIPERVPIGGRDMTPLNDSRWHRFKLIRNGTQLRFTVDGRYPQFHNVSQEFQFISPALVHIAGSKDTSKKTYGRISKNFVGGLTRLRYTARSNDGKDIQTEVDLLISKLEDTSKDRVRTTRFPGSDRQFPQTTPRPAVTTSPTAPFLTSITLKEKGVYIPLGERFSVQPGSGISFKFQTYKQKGLLFYTKDPRGNFLASEMFDGKVYFIYNLGDKPKRAVVSYREVSNGQPHQFDLSVSNRDISLKLDRYVRRIRLNARERLPPRLSRLYFGGYTDEVKLPWHIWARESYQGCLEDMKISGQLINFHYYLLSRKQDEMVEKQCVLSARQCPRVNPCNDGVCKTDFGGYVCDCRDTGFRGDHCQYPAWTGMFNGSIDYKMTFLSELKYHVNDISFRFRTMAADGIIFQTKAYTNEPFMRAELQNGKVVVATNLGGQLQEFKIAENLNDLKWHTVFIQRRGNDMAVWVDDIDYDRKLLPGDGYQLRVDDLFIGGHREEDFIDHPDVKHFIGYLQNLIFDDLDVLDVVNNRSRGILITGPNLPQLVFQDVTFPSSDMHLELPPLESLSGLKLSFLLRTNDPSGVVLFNEGRNKEMFLVELLDGVVVLKIKTADNPAVELRSPAYSPINDGKWHSITISHKRDDKVHEISFSVDGIFGTITFTGEENIDMMKPLYVGGIPTELHQMEHIGNALSSKIGFRGCLASFDLGSARGIEDLYDHALNQEVPVLSSCQEIRRECQGINCQNNGICQEFPKNQTIWCDCSKTGYAGSRCNIEPTGYLFGHSGMMVYDYSPSDIKNSDYDEIVMGFITHDRNADVLRLDSTTSEDFISVKLINGYVAVIYNTEEGEPSSTITSDSAMVNDGKYHIMKFTRTRDRSHLTVDGQRSFNNHTASHGQFDALGKISIGGLADGNIVKETGFRGIIAGLNINGDLIFESAERGKNTQFYNDVAEALHPFWLEKLPATTTPSVVITTSGDQETSKPGEDVSYQPPTSMPKGLTEDDIVTDQTTPRVIITVTPDDVEDEETTPDGIVTVAPDDVEDEETTPDGIVTVAPDDVEDEETTPDGIVTVAPDDVDDGETTPDGIVTAAPDDVEDGETTPDGIVTVAPDDVDDGETTPDGIVTVAPDDVDDREATPDGIVTVAPDDVEDEETTPDGIVTVAPDDVEDGETTPDGIVTVAPDDVDDGETTPDGMLTAAPDDVEDGETTPDGIVTVAPDDVDDGETTPDGIVTAAPDDVEDEETTPDGIVTEAPDDIEDGETTPDGIVTVAPDDIEDGVTTSDGIATVAPDDVDDKETTPDGIVTVAPDDVDDGETTPDGIVTAAPDDVEDGETTPDGIVTVAPDDVEDEETTSDGIVTVAPDDVDDEETTPDGIVTVAPDDVEDGETNPDGIVTVAPDDVEDEETTPDGIVIVAPDDVGDGETTPDGIVTAAPDDVEDGETTPDGIVTAAPDDVEDGETTPDGIVTAAPDDVEDGETTPDGIVTVAPDDVDDRETTPDGIVTVAPDDVEDEETTPDGIVTVAPDDVDDGETTPDGIVTVAPDDIEDGETTPDGIVTAAPDDVEDEETTSTETVTVAPDDSVDGEHDESPKDTSPEHIPEIPERLVGPDDVQSGETTPAASRTVTPDSGSDSTEEESSTPLQPVSLGYYFGLPEIPGSYGALAYRYPASAVLDSDYDEVIMEFTTEEKNAVLIKLLSEVSGDFIEMKLVNGKVEVSYDTDGSDSPSSVINSDIPVNDGKYHVLHFVRTESSGSLSIDDDEVFDDHLTVHGQFDQLDKIFIGGRMQDGNVVDGTGFRGVISGLYVNGDFLFVLARDNNRLDHYGDVVIHHPRVTETETSPSEERETTATTIDSARGRLDPTTSPDRSEEGTKEGDGSSGGDVIPFPDGVIRSPRSVGYTFGRQDSPGSYGTLAYRYPLSDVRNSDYDEIKMGITTQESNAVLIKLLSQAFGDFIEMKLVNGYVVVTYDTDGYGSPLTIRNSRIFVSDGGDHMIRFVRTETRGTLTIDGQEIFSDYWTPDGRFDRLDQLYVGGELRDGNVVQGTGFRGIIKGLYVNGEYILVLARGGNNFESYGVVSEVQDSPDMKPEASTAPKVDPTSGSVDREREGVDPTTSPDRSEEGMETPHTTREGDRSSGGDVIPLPDGVIRSPESFGYTFGRQDSPGSSGTLAFRYPLKEVRNSDYNEIRMEMTTQERNAVLLKLLSRDFGDFIEMKLVNGYVVVTYDTDGGDSPSTMRNSGIFVSDGGDHLIRFVRTRDKGTLSVDGQDIINDHSTPHAEFDDLDQMYIGGELQDGNVVTGTGFRGVIKGLYVDGEYMLVLARLRDDFENYGLVSVAQDSPDTKPDASSAPRVDPTSGSVEREREGVDPTTSPDRSEEGMETPHGTREGDRSSGGDVISYPDGGRRSPGSLGYTFGRPDIPGSYGTLAYRYPMRDVRNSDYDEIMMGITTRERNAVLLKLLSQEFGDFIEMKLVNGYVVVTYDTDGGDSPSAIRNSGNFVSDGGYHLLRFVRTGSRGTLSIDGQEVYNDHRRPHGQFDRLDQMYIGGELRDGNVVTGTGFRGVIKGLYVNGEYIFVLTKDGDNFDNYGAVIEVQDSPDIRPEASTIPRVDPTSGSVDRERERVDPTTSPDRSEESMKTPHTTREGDRSSGGDVISYPDGVIRSPESFGYTFGRQDSPGSSGTLAFRYPLREVRNSDYNEIRMEMTTQERNAVLLKLLSQEFGDFIEMKLVNGYVVVTYDTDGGDSPSTMRNSGIFVSDGGDHLIRFVRTRDKGTLSVDGQDIINDHRTPHAEFDDLDQMYIGGELQDGNVVTGTGFRGVIKGLYVDGEYMLVLARDSDDFENYGLVSVAQDSPDMKPDASSAPRVDPTSGSVDREREGVDPTTSPDRSEEGTETPHGTREGDRSSGGDVISYPYGGRRSPGSLGYTFGRPDIPGSYGTLAYRYPMRDVRNRDYDEIMMGITTRERNAVLLKLLSQEFGDFIEMKLVNGYVVVTYDTDRGDSPSTIRNSGIFVSDGGYHLLRFVRTESRGALSIDGQEVYNDHRRPHGQFDRLDQMYIGGELRDGNVVTGTGFRGAITGLNVNGEYIFVLAKDGDNFDNYGAVIEVQDSPDIRPEASTTPRVDPTSGSVDREREGIDTTTSPDRSEEGMETPHGTREGDRSSGGDVIPYPDGGRRSPGSLGYTFGRQDIPGSYGTLAYRYPMSAVRTSNYNEIMMGITTKERNAVLIKLFSQAFGDYIEMKLVNGYVVVSYDTDGYGSPSTIRNSGIFVSDGGYHLLRFDHTGTRGTLSIDGQEIFSDHRTPQRFDRLDQMYIGGELRNGNVVTGTGFRGVIRGLYVNGEYIFVLAKDGANFENYGAVSEAPDSPDIRPEASTAASVDPTSGSVDREREGIDPTTSPDRSEEGMETPHGTREGDRSSGGDVIFYPDGGRRSPGSLGYTFGRQDIPGSYGTLAYRYPMSAVRTSKYNEIMMGITTQERNAVLIKLLSQAFGDYIEMKLVNGYVVVSYDTDRYGSPSTIRNSGIFVSDGGYHLLSFDHTGTRGTLSIDGQEIFSDHRTPQRFDRLDQMYIGGELRNGNVVTGTGFRGVIRGLYVNGEYIFVLAKDGANFENYGAVSEAPDSPDIRPEASTAASVDPTSGSVDREREGIDPTTSPDRSEEGMETPHGTREGDRSSGGDVIFYPDGGRRSPGSLGYTFGRQDIPGSYGTLAYRYPMSAVRTSKYNEIMMGITTQERNAVLIKLLSQAFGDYIEMKLVNGYVVVSYDTDRYGSPSTIRNSGIFVSDGGYHLLSFDHTGTRGTLSIDGQEIFSDHRTPQRFDRLDQMYIGGELRNGNVVTGTGFRGVIRGLYVNGEYIFVLAKDGANFENYGAVSEAPDSPDIRPEASTAASVDPTSGSVDREREGIDPTTSPDRSEEGMETPHGTREGDRSSGGDVIFYPDGGRRSPGSLGYTFGRQDIPGSYGTLAYRYPMSAVRTSKYNEIMMGITTQERNAVLIKLLSQAFGDYIEMKLVNGYVVVSYDTDRYGSPSTIRNSGIFVSDGGYHLLSFDHTGTRGTLSIDGQEIFSDHRTPQRFDRLDQMYIGGELRNGNVVTGTGFRGVIRGLYVNGEYIFVLAKDGANFENYGAVSEAPDSPDIRPEASTAASVDPTSGSVDREREGIDPTTSPDRSEEGMETPHGTREGDRSSGGDVIFYPDGGRRSPGSLGYTFGRQDIPGSYGTLAYRYPMSAVRTSKYNEIMMGITTQERNAVLIKLLSQAFGDYIEMKLVNGYVVVSYDTDRYGSPSTIRNSGIFVSDGGYHLLSFDHTGTRGTLSIDGQEIFSDHRTPQRFDRLDQMYIGGELRNGNVVTGTGFRGVIRGLYVNGEYIFVLAKDGANFENYGAVSEAPDSPDIRPEASTAASVDPTSGSVDREREGIDPTTSPDRSEEGMETPHGTREGDRSSGGDVIFYPDGGRRSPGSLGYTFGRQDIPGSYGTLAYRYPMSAVRTSKYNEIMMGITTQERNAVLIKLLSQAFGDYIEMKLVNGYVVVSYDTDRYGSPSTIRNSGIFVSDGGYHLLSFDHTGTRGTLSIDGQEIFSDHRTPQRFDRLDQMYIGGELRNGNVVTGTGFRGVIRGLYVNGEYIFVLAKDGANFENYGAVSEAPDSPDIRPEASTAASVDPTSGSVDREREGIDPTTSPDRSEEGMETPHGTREGDRSSGGDVIFYPDGGRRSPGSLGYTFGRQDIPGSYGTLAYRYPMSAVRTSKYNEIMMGITTQERNAVLIKLLSQAFGDYIEMKLVNGYVVVSYDTDRYGSPSTIRNSGIFVSDGGYHLLSFDHTGTRGTLSIDGQEIFSDHRTPQRFDRLDQMYIGGELRNGNVVTGTGFRGVIRGLYVNGEYIFVLAKDGANFENYGAVSEAPDSPDIRPEASTAASVDPTSGSVDREREGIDPTTSPDRSEEGIETPHGTREGDRSSGGDVISYPDGGRRSPGSLGYTFGRQDIPGSYGTLAYRYPMSAVRTSNYNEIMMGITTQERNAVLIKLLSQAFGDYIEMKLVNGYVVVSYDTDRYGSPSTIRNSGIFVSDGGYHLLRFDHTGTRGTLSIDGQEIFSDHRTPQRFDRLDQMYIGGELRNGNVVTGTGFRGVIRGLYVNGEYIFVLAKDGANFENYGAVIEAPDSPDMPEASTAANVDPTSGSVDREREGIDPTTSPDRSEEGMETPHGTREGDRSSGGDVISYPDGGRRSPGSLGYTFGRQDIPGSYGTLAYRYPMSAVRTSNYNEIMMGITTQERNAVLIKLLSQAFGDYIEMKLVNGYVVVSYDTDRYGSPSTIRNSGIFVSDGGYHLLRFDHTGTRGTLSIDGQEIFSDHRTPQRFDRLDQMYIGGDLRNGNVVTGTGFRGVIRGLYVNGEYIFVLAKDGVNFENYGAVIEAPDSPDIMPEARPIPRVDPTVGSVDREREGIEPTTSPDRSEEGMETPHGTREGDRSSGGDVISYPDGGRRSPGSLGYTFGRQDIPGSYGTLAYRYPMSAVRTSNYNEIMMGITTQERNAVLIKLLSQVFGDYIEMKLVNGYVVVSYDTDGYGSPSTIRNSGIFVSDGGYHLLRFDHTGTRGTLSLDGQEIFSDHRTPQQFDRLDQMYIGGDLRNGNVVTGTGFRGVIRGLYVNGEYIFVLARDGDNLESYGAVSEAQDSPDVTTDGRRIETTETPFDLIDREDDLGETVTSSDTDEEEGSGTGEEGGEETSHGTRDRDGTSGSSESLGYYFGQRDTPSSYGTLIYNYPDGDAMASNKDDIILGVVTEDMDGMLIKLLSQVSGDFIEIKLVTGYVEVTYNTEGDGSPSTVSNNMFVSDGKYHIIHFERTDATSTLSVDRSKMYSNHWKPHGKFDGLSQVYIGGVVQGGNLVDGTGFRGTITGLFVNGELLFTFVRDNIRTELYGDVVFAQQPYTNAPLKLLKRSGEEPWTVEI